MVLIGGIKRIALVAGKLVPFMAIAYFLAGILILLLNVGDVPNALMLVVRQAFTETAATGGFAGAAVWAAIQFGVARGVFSNEAGLGSAPIAHAAARTNSPVRQGVVAMLGTFIDTIIVCTMTALVIVISGAYQNEGLAGVTLTSQAFSDVITWFPVVLALAVILFAFSTMITWSYYGLKAWTYLFGETRKADLTYKSLFCVFVIIGSAMQLGKVIEFSDAMIFMMTVPNILGLYFLMPEVKRELNSYFTRLHAGEIRNFRAERQSA
jgi:AGCS family alanine or glycine:cation symporter